MAPAIGLSSAAHSRFALRFTVRNANRESRCTRVLSWHVRSLPCRAHPPHHHATERCHSLGIACGILHEAAEVALHHALGSGEGKGVEAQDQLPWRCSFHGLVVLRGVAASLASLIRGRLLFREGCRRINIVRAHHVRMGEIEVHGSMEHFGLYKAVGQARPRSTANNVFFFNVSLSG